MRRRYMRSIGWLAGFTTVHKPLSNAPTPHSHHRLLPLVTLPLLLLLLPHPALPPPLASGRCRVNQLLTATAPVSTLSAGSGEESVTLLAALAAMHHRPALDWLEAFCDASVHRLEGLRGGSLAVLGAALATLHFLPSDSWVGAFLDACRARLSAGDMDAPDAATLLAALAALRVSPPEPWLHACLGVLGGTLRTLDAERLASVAVSLASLGVIIKDGPWLDAYVSMTSVRLSGMSSESRVALLRALAAFGTALPRAWVAVYQLICVRQAEAGGMTAAQIEQASAQAHTLRARTDTHRHRHTNIGACGTLNARPPPAWANMSTGAVWRSVQRCPSAT